MGQSHDGRVVVDEGPVALETQETDFSRSQLGGEESFVRRVAKFVALLMGGIDAGGEVVGGVEAFRRQGGGRGGREESGAEGGHGGS